MSPKITVSIYISRQSVIRAAFSLYLFSCQTASSNENRIVEVHENNGLYSIYAEAYLSAEPERVWSHLTNCAKAKDFVPYLISCRILKEDKISRWDIRENISAPPLSPKVRTVIRNEFRKNEFSYQLISGDLKFSEGYWKVERDVRGSRIIYSARFEPSIVTPKILMTNALRRNIVEMFRKLDRLSEGKD